jgi:hypothetical protein
MDAKTSVLNIASEILHELQLTHVISLEELDEFIQSRIGESARLNFVPALNLLFLTGCLDYDENTDAILYLKNSGEGQ